MAKAVDIDVTLGSSPTSDPINIYKKVAEANNNRKRLIFQNKGPGNVWLSVRDEGNNSQIGLKLVAGAAFVDDPPYVHCDEWWAMTDAAATTLTVVQWT